MRLYHSIRALAVFLGAALWPPSIYADVSLPPLGPDNQVQYSITAEADAAAERLSMNPVPTSLDGALVLASSAGFTSFRFNGEPGYDYYLFYFSAHWCPPCRIFTPQLVDFYRQLSVDNKKRILVVFVSRDNSEREMLSYMIESEMPWPAIDYKKIGALPQSIKRLAGPGVPDLVLVDPFFKVLADSYINGKYLGPQKVLDKTAVLLNTSGAAGSNLSQTTVNTTKTTLTKNASVAP